MRVTKKNQEMKVYGQHAVLALFKKRPQDVIRAYVTQDGIFKFRDLIRYLVDQRLTYHVVESEELDKLARGTHHEGLMVVAKTRKSPTLRELLSDPSPGLIVALEAVENPHNLGAIMRSCAHFGVKALLYEAKVPVAQSAAALRTAEGGAESVHTLHLDNWAEVFELAQKNNFELLATSSHQGQGLFDFKFPPKTILFMGAEGPGLSPKMLKKIQHSLTIPGTQEVESLNVSTATAVILTEWYRQQK
jgi:RNA methyltransferase, TrmH family